MLYKQTKKKQELYYRKRPQSADSLSITHTHTHLQTDNVTKEATGFIGTIKR